MKFCVVIFIFILLLYGLFLYIRMNKFIKKLENEKNIKKEIESEENNKIVIAIPCLREQNIIEDTIKYFNEIAPNIPIVIITTQKEIKENNKNRITTQEIVKNQIFGKYKNVYLINYPYTVGYMADQINYMLEHIREILKDNIKLENTYLALYNADSRPSKQTFKEVEDKINKGNRVIQQYSYCMQNYNKLSNILKGFSIYQSNFEIKTGLINSSLNAKFLYTHVVGHGLIINMQLLKYMGNFNTKFWCEDVYLGLQLKFNNIKITPVISLENIETPTSFKSLIKQNSVWFKTTSQFLKIYKDILKNSKTTNKIKGLIGCLNEFRCAINWIGFPLILFANIVYSLVSHNFTLFFAIIMSYIFYIYVNIYMTIKIVNRIDKKNYKISIKMLINVAMATLISNIGPIYSILVNRKEKYKTER